MSCWALGTKPLRELRLTYCQLDPWENSVKFESIYMYNFDLTTILYIDGLVQEICNSSALALELRLSCTNLSISRGHCSMIADDLVTKRARTSAAMVSTYFLQYIKEVNSSLSFLSSRKPREQSRRPVACVARCTWLSRLRMRPVGWSMTTRRWYGYWRPRFYSWRERPTRDWYAGLEF